MINGILKLMRKQEILSIVEIISVFCAFVSWWLNSEKISFLPNNKKSYHCVSITKVGCLLISFNEIFINKIDEKDEALCSCQVSENDNPSFILIHNVISYNILTVHFFDFKNN